MLPASALFQAVDLDRKKELSTSGQHFCHLRKNLRRLSKEYRLSISNLFRNIENKSNQLLAALLMRKLKSNLIKLGAIGSMWIFRGVD
jgi:hypothetical protein